MNQTTPNLPNRTSLQPCNSLPMVKRMTLPLSGQTPPRRMVMGALAALGMAAAVIGTMTQASAAISVYTNTNTATAWSSNGTGDWAPSNPSWDAASGANETALFTNTSAFSLGISGNVYVNNITFTNAAGALNLGTAGSSSLTFAGASEQINYGANNTNNLYASLILTNTLTINGSNTAILNLYGSNFFTNGTITEQGGTGFRSIGVYGTNYGGTYNLYGMTINNGGLVTNAIINFTSTGGTLTVNDTNQASPVLTVAAPIAFYNQSGAGNTITVNSSFNGVTGSAINVQNYTLQAGNTINFNNASTNATNNTFGSSTITLSGGSFGYSAAGSGAGSVASLPSVIVTNNIASSIAFTNASTSNNFLLGNITRNDNSMLQFSIANAGTTGRVALTNNGSNLSFSGGILSWAVDTSGGGFITTNAVNGTNYLIGTFGSTNANAKVADINTASSTDNYRFVGTGATNLNASITVNSLAFSPGGASTLSLGANTLTVASGGILQGNATSMTITNGVITVGNGSGAYNLYLWNTGSTNMIIGSLIADNGGNAVSLFKAGGTASILAASNSYTGATVIEGGSLVNTNTGDLRNSAVTVGSTNMPSAASFYNYGTVSNVTVGLGNGIGNANTNFYNSGTILGQLNIVGGTNGGFSYTYGNTGLNYSIGGAYLDTGTTVTNVKVSGSLLVGGSGNMSLSGIVGDNTSTNSQLIGNGTNFSGKGVITVANTYTNANAQGGQGVVLNFANGFNAFQSLLLGTTSGAGNYFTLAGSSTSTNSFVSLGYSSTTTPITNGITFSGGTWLIGELGQNNSNGKDSSTHTITNGAVVNVATNYGYLGAATFNINQGSLNFTNGGGGIVANAVKLTNSSLVFSVNGNGTLTDAAALTLGNANATQIASGQVSSLNVNGGQAIIGGAVILGGGTANTNEVSLLSVSNNGLLVLSNNLTVGDGVNHVNQSNTVTLGSGTMIVNGTIASGSGASGASNSFFWTGGSLGVGTISVTNTASQSAWTGAASGSSISNNTLYNTNAGNLLVGNTNNTYAGKTVITGNYNQSGNGVTTFKEIGVNAPTNSSAWVGGTTNYSQVAVSGTALFGGSVAVIMTNGYDIAGSSAVLTNATFASSAASLTNATLSATTTNGITGSFKNATNSSYNAYSWLNTNGYGAYELNSSATNLTFSYATNSYVSGNWGTAGVGAWSAGIDPNSSNAIAYFGAGSSTNVTLDASRTVGGLILNNASGYNLNGSSTLTLTPSANLGVNAVIANKTNNLALNIPLNLTGTTEITNSLATSSVTLGGAISGNGGLQIDSNGTTILTGADTASGQHTINSGAILTVTNSGSLATGAVAVNGSLNLGSSANSAPGLLSGSGSITQSGLGTLTLASGNNTFSGSAALKAGGLVIGAGSTLTNATINQTAGTLSVAGTAGNVTSSGGTLTGSGSLGALTVSSSATVAPGGVGASASANLTVSSLVINGGIFNLNLFGSTIDTITSTGSVTFGSSPVSLAIMTNSFSSGWDQTQSTNYTIFSGVNATSGTFMTNNFNFNGSSVVGGTWSVTTNATSLLLVYTANATTVTVTSLTGTINESSDSTQTTPFNGATAPLLKVGAGEYVLDMSNGYAGATYIAAGTLTVATNGALGASPTLFLGYSTNNSASGSNSVFQISNAGQTVSQGITVAPGTAQYSVQNSSGAMVAFSGGITLNTNLALSNTSGGNLIINSAIIGTGALTVAPGSGTVTLAAAGTYTGGTTLNGGTLAVSNSTALGSGTLSVTTNATVQALTGVNLANNVAVATGGNTLTLDANGNVLTNSGNISGNAASLAVISSTGSGTVILSGSNSYTGTSTVNGSTLVLGSSNALASNTALTIGNTGTVDLSGKNTTIGSLNDGGSGAVLTNSGSGSSLTVNGSSSSSFIGTIAGALGLNKSGAGTMTLGGNDVYTGATIVSAGGFVLNGSISNSAVTVTNATFTESVSGSINGTNGVTAASNSTVILGGINSYTGATAVNSGANVTLNGSISNSAVTVTNATLTEGTTGSINGTNGLTVQNGSTVNLSGVNTYTGVTTVTNATLNYQSSGSFASTTNLTVNNGGNVNFTNSGTTNNLVVLTGSGQGGSITLNAGSSMTISNGANVVFGVWNSPTQTNYNSTQINVNGATLTVGAQGTLTASATNIGSRIGIANGGTISILSGGYFSPGTYSQSWGTGSGTNTVTNAFGGTISMGGAYLGNGGSGLNQVLNNGYITNNGNFYVGYASNATATNLLQNFGTGTIISSNQLTIGNAQAALNELINSGTITTISNNIVVGNGASTGINLLSNNGGTINYGGAGSGAVSIGNNAGAIGLNEIILNGGTMSNSGISNSAYFTIGASAAQTGTNQFLLTNGASFYGYHFNIGTAGSQNDLVSNNGGTMNVSYNVAVGGGASNNASTFYVGNGSLTIGASGFNIGGSGTSSLSTGATNTMTIDNGGVVNSSSALTLGGYSVNSTNRLNITGGTANLTSLTLGAVTGSYTNTNGGATNIITASGNTNTIKLSSGKVAISGTFSATTNDSAVNSFVWSGGSLSAGTIVATNATWTGAGSSISNSTLYNTNAGNNFWVGNMTNGYAGKTVVTGNYNQGSSGTSTFNVFGTNQATNWTGGTTNYSFLTNSGTASLAGSIVANFGSFTPATNNSFTLVGAAGGLTSTATLSGSNAYNGFAFWNDGLNYSKLSTSATTLSLVYGGLNQWQGGTGTWDATTNNWTAGVNPNGTNFVAYFGTNGAGGSITVSGNKTNSSLILSNNTVGYTLNGPGSLTLGNAGTANLTSYGSNVVNPNIALNGQLNVGGTGTLNLVGNISGNYGLYDSNSGTVYLSGSNSYTGVTTVSGGTLVAVTTNSINGYQTTGNVVITNNGTLTVTLGANNWSTASFGTLLNNATIASGAVGLDSSAGGGTVTNNFAGNYSLAVSGTGTITLEGNNSGLSNGITLVSGTLAVDGNSSANALGGGSSTLTLQGNNAQKIDLGGTTQSLNSITVNAATTGVLTLTNGTLSLANGSPAVFAGLNEASNASISAPGTYGIFLGAAPNAPYDGGVSKFPLNALAVQSVLAGSNNVSNIQIAAGGVQLENANALGSGTLWIAGSSTVSSVGGFTNAGAQSVDMSSTSVQLTAQGNLNFGNAVLAIGSGTNTLNVSSGVLTFTNGVGNGAFSAGGQIVKQGNGTLVLGGSSTASGTTLNGGTILALGANSLGANLTLASGLLDLGNNNDTFGTVAFNGSGFQITNGSITATSGYTASNAAISLNLSGNGATFTAGGGTVTLTGANTYTGATVVTNGTLYSTFNAGTTYMVTNSGSTFVAGVAIDPTWTAAGVGSITLNPGTTLAIDATGTNFALTASLTNGANAILGTYGTGTVTLADSQTNYSAISKIVVSSGTLDLGGVVATNQMTLTNVTISGGTVKNGTLSTTNLTIASNANATIAANLVGTAGLTNTNATITLSGSNTYTGVTALKGGVTTLNGSLSNTAITITNATLTESSMGSITVAGGSTQLTLSKGANVNLSGSNSFIITNSVTTPAILVNSNATLSIASANALTPSVTAYNPGGTNYSTNNTRFILLGVTGGQVFFTNSGVTTTIAGGTNIASFSNSVATNINVNENILLTGTGNGATNLVISSGATLVQYSPAGNQGSSLALQSNAVMLIGSGGTYINNNTGNNILVGGGKLQVDVGGLITNTVVNSNSGAISVGSANASSIVTNAGTIFEGSTFTFTAGTNELDNTGVLTVVGNFRANGGVNTINLLAGSTTYGGINLNGGTNIVTVYSGATNFGAPNVGYNTTGSSNLFIVKSGGMVTNTNSSTIFVGQALSSSINTLSNNGSVYTAALDFNGQSGNSNNSTVYQGSGTLSASSINFNGGNGSGQGNNNTALLDVMGGLLTNSGTMQIGVAGTNNLNTLQIDGGAASLAGVVLGSTTNSNSHGNTNRILLNGGTLTANQFTLGAGSAAAGDSNIITFNGGTLLAGSAANTNFMASGVASVSLNAGGGIIDSSNKSITIGASINGTGALTKVGVGTLTLSGLNTYSGGSTLNGGTLNITSGSSMGSGVLSMADGTTLGYSGASADTLVNDISLTSGNGTIANTSGSALTLSGTLNNKGTLLTLAAGTFNVNGAITGAYALSNAAVTLSGSNSYSAPTSIFAGSSLAIGGNDNFSTASVLNLGASSDLATQTNTLDLAGYNQSVASIATVGSGASQIIDNVGGGTFTIKGNCTFSGSIGGLTTTAPQRNLNLTIGSGANVNLTGNNTYTGTTTVQNGSSLDLGGGGQLSGTTNVIVNNGRLLLGGNSSSNSINTAANLQLNRGTLSADGTNATSRTATQTFATLTLTVNSKINYIDFADRSGDSSLIFANIEMNGNTLDIFDWSGTNQWGTQSTTQTDYFTHLFDQGILSASDLANINFYAGNSISSQFLGSATQLGSGEIVPVPEPGVIVAAALLVGWMLFNYRGMLVSLIYRRRA